MSGDGDAEVNATPEPSIAILKTDETDSEVSSPIYS
jgi:hypothetical protein